MRLKVGIWMGMTSAHFNVLPKSMIYSLTVRECISSHTAGPNVANFLPGAHSVLGCTHRRLRIEKSAHGATEGANESAARLLRPPPEGCRP
jgi:hypothetical protein